MESSLDLNDLRVFQLVVDLQSFSAAARRLGRPRSSVSRRITQLERVLGVRLLHRTTRRLQLTDLGASFYDRCAAALSSIDEAEMLVREAQVVPRGHLRFTAPHDMDDYVAPLVASFVCKYPEATVSVELTQRRVDLVGEGYDVALRATSVLLSDSSLVARRIASGQGGLYASTRYLERAGVPAEPGDLVHHRCIVFGPHHRPFEQWPLVHRDGRETTVTVAGHIFVNDPSFARACAAAHAGITFLPSGIPDARAHELVRVLPEWSFARAGALYVMYPSAKHLSATVRAFRDHLIEGLASLPWVTDAPSPNGS